MRENLMLGKNLGENPDFGHSAILAVSDSGMIGRRSPSPLLRLRFNLNKAPLSPRCPPYPPTRASLISRQSLG